MPSATKDAKLEEKKRIEQEEKEKTEIQKPLLQQVLIFENNFLRKIYDTILF